MRNKDDYNYTEWKDGAEDAFHMLRHHWSAKECRSMFESQQNEAGGIIGSSKFLFVMAVVYWEVQLDVLEDLALDVASYYIYRFENMGRYRADLTPEEIEEIEEDIAYIKSKVDLPELESYDDSIMEEGEEE